jgi:hypothetical protein
MGMNKIDRLYVPKDYRRGHGFIWSLFSPEDVRKNMEIFFECLPQVYDSIIDEYFPSLKSELYFFKDFDRLIVVIDAKEEYKNWQDTPSIECFYLRNTQKKESIVNVYMKSDGNVPIDGSVQFGSDIVIDGNTYQWLVHSSAILDFIYHDLPMLEYVYDLLDRRFRSFFEEKWPS